jgi:nitroreductase
LACSAAFPHWKPMNKPLSPQPFDPRGAAAMFERYRRDDSPKPTQWNDTLDLILAHRSHRNFLHQPLPEGALETIVAAAQSASTSSNLQVWSVVAVEDEARKIRLADLAGGQKHIRDCPLFLVWLCDLARLEHLGREKGRDAAALPYLGIESAAERLRRFRHGRRRSRSRGQGRGQTAPRTRSGASSRAI